MPIALGMFMAYLVIMLYLDEKQEKYVYMENIKQKEEENRSLNKVVT